MRKFAAMAAAAYLTGSVWAVAMANDVVQDVQVKDKTIFRLYYYDSQSGETAEEKERIKTNIKNQMNQVPEITVAYPTAKPLTHDWSDMMRAGVLLGTRNIADIVEPSLKGNTPLSLVVATGDFANVSGSNRVRGEVMDVDYMRRAMQTGAVLPMVNLFAENPEASPYGVGLIVVGENLGIDRHDGNYGFTGRRYATAVPASDDTVDIGTVVAHELYHTLGMFARTGMEKINKDNDTMEYVFRFQDTGMADSWNSHLIDQNGNRARSGMQIIGPDDFQRIQLSNPEASPADYFIIDKNKAAPAYFVGTHISDVLDGKHFNGRDGIPVTGWEDYGQGVLWPDLSHSEVARSLMSHQMYGSYNAPIEVELAMLQDMGYAIDRRNFFGYSVYADDRTEINNRVFYGRNEDGTAYVPGTYNTSMYGIGLHVYGSDNHIEQRGTIWTKGEAAVGIRLDGLRDAVTVPQGTVVRADGINGIGVLTAYGSEDTVTVDGTLTALGPGGRAISFDFGTNTLGGGLGYYGSYIAYLSLVDENGNREFYKMIPPEELRHPMGTVNVGGTVAGRAQAIYIAPNAYVPTVNFTDGARVSGEIRSDWKHFSSDNPFYDELLLYYKGVGYSPSQYLPELVTRLRFNGDVHVDGDVKGTDTIKMNVDSGTLSYSGTATIINASVAPGATLLGGTYQLTYISEQTAKNMERDDETGRLINRGTIGAKTPTGDVNTLMRITQGTVQKVTETVPEAYKTLLVDPSVVTVTNDYGFGASESPVGHVLDSAGGTYRFTAKGAAVGVVQTDGTANVDHMRIAVADDGYYEPLRTYDNFFVARSFAGQEEAVVTQSDRLLTAQYESLRAPISEDSPLYSLGTLRFIPVATEALPTTYTENMRRVYGILRPTYDETGDMTGTTATYRKAYSPLLNLSTAKAGEVLASLYNELPSEGAAMVMQSTISRDAIYRHLHEGDHGEEYPIWATTEKVWGPDGHRTGVVVGADRFIGTSGIAGLFASYEADALSRAHGKGSIKDYRFGIYGRWGRLESGALAVYASYGKQSGDLTRYLSYAEDIGADWRYDSRYGSHTWAVGAEGSKTFRVGGDSSWQYTPYVRFDVLHLSGSDAVESGTTGYALHLSGDDATVAMAGGGVRLERIVSDRTQYGVDLSYDYVLSGDAPRWTGTFGGPTGTIPMDGRGIWDHQWTIGVYGRTAVSERWSVSGALTRRLAPSADTVGLSLYGQWKF